MTTVARTEDSDYSPTWKWVDDEVLEGRHVEFRRPGHEPPISKHVGIGVEDLAAAQVALNRLADSTTAPD